MAAVVSENFEGGANNITITTVNTSADQVTGAMVFDTDAAIHNSVSGLVDAQTAAAEMRWDFTSTATCWARGYYISSTPDLSTPFGYTIMLARGGGVEKWRVYAQAEGNLYLQHKGGGTWQTVGTTGRQILDGSTLFRLEVGSTATDLTLNAYYGDNAEGTVPDETVTGSYAEGAVDQFRTGMGQAQPVPVTLLIDDVVVDNAANPGTAAGIPSFLLSGSYPANEWDHRTATWVIDTRASVGAVSLQQAAGPTAAPVESPVGVFTVADPGAGGAAIVYNVVATSANGVPASRRVVLTRGGRAARLVLQPGGAATDVNNWR